MTGAVPNTGWLAGCVALDAKGFIKTGPDLSADDLSAARWPLARPPHLPRDRHGRVDHPAPAARTEDLAVSGGKPVPSRG